MSGDFVQAWRVIDFMLIGVVAGVNLSRAHLYFRLYLRKGKRSRLALSLYILTGVGFMILACDDLAKSLFRNGPLGIHTPVVMILALVSFFALRGFARQEIDSLIEWDGHERRLSNICNRQGCPNRIPHPHHE